MSTRISIHNVESVSFGEVEPLTVGHRTRWVRTVSFADDEGHKTTIDVFADEQEALVVPWTR